MSLSRILIWSLVVAKLWLVSGQPLFALADNSHDDLLFVRLANHLAQFQWLGPYDNLTLAKGPFYSIWIALVFLAGIPLLLSQHLLYIAGCLVIERALHPLIANLLWRTAILVLLLFNPVSFTWQLTRVLRDGLYSGLVLLIAGSAIGLLARRHETVHHLTGWSVTCGLATAAFWLTREEGVWILPLLVPLLAFTMVVAVLSDRWDWWRIIIIALPLLLPIATLQIVSVVNLACYGIYATVELKTPTFKAAYGALTRVRPVEHKPQVPVAKETRLRIYQESTAFAELRAFFEKDEFWTLHAVGFNNHLSGTDEIGGGWFMWALRDATAKAGHFGSGRQAAIFFQRLTDEVNTACQDKRLDCLAERASLIPPWRSEYLIPIIKKIISGFGMLVTFSQVSPGPIASSGSQKNILFFNDITHERPSGRGIMIQGWAVHASSKKLTAALVESDTNGVVSLAHFDSSPDVHQYFLSINQNIMSANNARFDIRGRCIRTCVLRISNESGPLADIPLKRGQTAWFNDPLWVFIDEVSSDTILPRQAQLEEFKLLLLRKITATYQLMIPYLAMTTLLAIGYWLLYSIRNHRLTILGLLAICIAATVLTRLLILAIIDVTSFPGMIVEYLSPLYPLSLLCWSFFIIDLMQSLYEERSI